MTEYADQQTAEPKLPIMQRLTEKLSKSRFFTVSLLLHVIIVIFAGSTVMFQMAKEAPDFEAGNGGLMMDSAEASKAPEPEQEPRPDMQPSTPEPTSAALDVLVTNNANATMRLNAPVAEPKVKGISDNMASTMASISKKAGESIGAASAGTMGKIGGTKMMGTIFGKKIEAAKLGVILDVSGSAHPHLAGAIKEIEKAFPDAIDILYPGCGLMDFKGKRPHEIKKLAAIPKKDIDPGAPNFTTGAQLGKAMKIEEFEKMTKKPSLQDKLFVSWCDEDKGGGNLTGHVVVAFDDLIKRKVDTIYWFADFADQVSPEAANELLKDLKRHNIKVHMHNFAGKPIPATTMELAEKTGGTINTEKPK